MTNKVNNHILLCVTNDLSQDQRMQKTADTLTEMGNLVTLVGRALIDSLPMVDRKYQQKRLKCWINSGIIFYIEYNIRLFFYLLSLKKINIVTACDLDTISGVYLAGKIKKSILIFDAHEYFIEVPELKNRRFKKKIWTMLERILVPRMDKCYTVNLSLAEIFNDRLGVKFEIVENWPRESSSTFHSNTRKNIFLYQGMLNEGRGLIEMTKIMKYFPEHVLWIIGNGVLEQEIKNIIYEFKLENQVKLLGFISPKDLPRFTSQALIGINLLVSDSLNYYYSSANKFFDYIHCDLPSINMNYPEYRRINDQFQLAVLVDDLKEASLISAINKLIDDKINLQLSANCQVAKKHLKWSQNVTIIQKLYLPKK